MESLTMSYNSIQALHQRMWQGLYRLRYLKLDHNQISGAPIIYSFIQTGNLYELDLSWNFIEMLLGYPFEGLVNLELLDLSHNKIYMVHTDVFVKLYNMLHRILLQITYTLSSINIYAKLTNGWLLIPSYMGGVVTSITVLWNELHIMHNNES